VTVNGRPAELLNKIGWPGTTENYRIDIRVPEGTPAGTATLQVSAGFITGGQISIPIQ
jgi:hypothetical protein